MTFNCSIQKTGTSQNITITPSINESSKTCGGTAAEIPDNLKQSTLDENVFMKPEKLSIEKGKIKTFYCFKLV